MWTIKYSPVDFEEVTLAIKCGVKSILDAFEMQIFKQLSQTANGLSADDAKQMASVSSAV